MPYKSQAQAGYMHVHHPDVAKRWDKTYGVSKDLPRKTPARPSLTALADRRT